MASQDSRFSHSGPDSDWGKEKVKHPGVVASTPRYYHIPYLIPTEEQVQSQWYQGGDLMDPCKVAPPACRVGRPNSDGYIGGDKGHPLPSN